MKNLFWMAPVFFVGACSSPPPPPHPSLVPVTVDQLLRYDTRAVNHLKSMQAADKTCHYKVDLPDQSSHPDSIEVNHIAVCSGRNDLKQFDTNVEFRWNKTENKWELAYIGG